MNLKLVNVAAMALILASAAEAHRPRIRRPLLILACLLDVFLIWFLMSQRHAATQATQTTMSTLKLVHIGASACFPLMYPFLLLGELEEEPGPGELSYGWLWTFLGLRSVSFLTSYFMVVR